MVCEDKRACLQILWYLTFIFSIAYVITSFFVASHNNIENSKQNGFAAIWSMLLLLTLIIYGTITMKTYKSPLAVGFFLGLSSMYAQLQFVLFILFLSLINRSPDGSAEQSSNRAFAAFSFILFVIFLVFSISLHLYRSYVIDDNSYSMDDQQTTTPYVSEPTSNHEYGQYNNGQMTVGGTQGHEQL